MGDGGRVGSSVRGGGEVATVAPRMYVRGRDTGVGNVWNRLATDMVQVFTVHWELGLGAHRGERRDRDGGHCRSGNGVCVDDGNAAVTIWAAGDRLIDDGKGCVGGTCLCVYAHLCVYVFMCVCVRVGGGVMRMSRRVVHRVSVCACLARRARVERLETGRQATIDMFLILRATNKGRR